MNKIFPCLAVVIVGILCACHTPGPNASSSDDSAESPALPTRVVPIDQQAFVGIQPGRTFDPKWLQTPTNLFRLGPGDQIEITILGEGGSQSAALVGPDGKIYFNLLPGLFVWGLTLSETKTLIEEKLAQFFRDRPQIAITLRVVTSQRMWILGNVKAPGVFGLATPTTVLEAIALAGGTAPAATGSEADTDLRGSFVMRDGQLLPVDLDRLLRKGDRSQNIYLAPDDFLYLRPGEGQSVYLMGAIRSPGALPYVDKMSLARAINSRGGAVGYARSHDVVILRGSLTNPMITSVDYAAIIRGKASDVMLEPGDIVYLPFVAYKALAELADGILRQFVSTVALNEGTRAVVPNAPPVGISVGVSGASPP